MSVNTGFFGFFVVVVVVFVVVVASDRRSAGTMLDDETIELKIPDDFIIDAELFDKVHINVTSVYGVVLLTGEAPTAAQRDRAVNYARNTEKVRVVHDEITIAPPSAMSSR